MINRLDLKHFKCFEYLRLPMASLTLLSGANASGKSTLLQALVLLHQTMHEHEWSTRLMLNGELLKLGTVGDVLDKVHGRKSFEISVIDGNSLCHWVFAGERGDMSMVVESVGQGGNTINNPKNLRFLLPADMDEPGCVFAQRVRGLSYITAERVGPREVYGLDDRQIATVVGPAGEHAASVLHWGRDELVMDGLVLPEVPPTRLRQVEERMRIFFPGCSIALQQIPNVNAVTLGFRTSDETDFHRPVHVGFGLTQGVGAHVHGESLLWMIRLGKK